MSKATWQKRFAILRSRLYLYPKPDPLSRTPLFWVAMGLVSLMVLLFSGFFIAYAFSRQDAFLTAAEDMGNMDQAVWSIIHGQILHQTICNVVSDTNCYSAAGFSRFAIHFEPMLFPVSLFYVIWSDPKTLLVLQTLIVASGAFPAFWLARLRLRSELAAVGIALVYLLYPAQQQATIFEFHAVTFTASLLLFTLYFMYTRRTVWLFVFAILSMACKEEIPLVIACFGLWSIIFQQRWRTGLGLVLLSIGWIGVTFWAYRHFSPTGHPLLASRYSYLGNGPVEIIRNFLLHPVSLIHQHVLEAAHRKYLRILLAPVGYLPLLAPWVLVLAVPSIAINLFSSDPNQYLGVFHYSAEIVPILVFATIEAIVVIIWVSQLLMDRMRAPQEQRQSSEQPLTVSRNLHSRLQPVLLIVLIGFVLFAVVREDMPYGSLPISKAFTWPQITNHARLAQPIIDMIPKSASVSAQSNLVPHISERKSIYLFPYQDNSSDYIFLDTTSFFYPFQSSYAYINEVKTILMGGKYGVIAAQDGYLLLKKGLPAPGISPLSPVQAGYDVLPQLSDNFCSFIRVSPRQVTHPLNVDFSSNTTSNTGLSLVGYSVAPPQSFSVVTPHYMQVTAYWKVNTPQLPPLTLQLLLFNTHGQQEFASADFPSLSWCPTSTWKPGTILRTTSSAVWIGFVPNGLAHVALALLPFTTSIDTTVDDTERLPLHILKAPPTVTLIKGRNALQLDSFIIGS